MKSVITAIGLSMSMALAGPALAQDGQKDAMKKGTMAMVGTVVDSKNVNLKGAAGTGHYLVKIESGKDKRRVVVNLGVQSDANKEIEKGDKIFAVGSAARINDRPVLFARYYGELQETTQK